MKINSIYPAIQGEGWLTGIPMILIRTQGCSVRCPFCDTKETWDPDKGQDWHVEQIITRVWNLQMGEHWALITGGEPLEQKWDTFRLAAALRDKGFSVCLETSGTVPLDSSIEPTHYFQHIVVSPKTGVNIASLDWADEIKFVVGPDNPVPCPALVPRQVKVSLQPISQDPKDTQICIEACRAYGWRLSVQVHKYLGIP